MSTEHMKRATKIPMLIRKEDGSIHEIKSRKVVVSEDDFTQDFSSVRNGYQVIQHKMFLIQ